MEKNYKKKTHFYISSGFKRIAKKIFQIPLTDLIKFAIIFDDKEIKNEVKKYYEGFKKMKLEGAFLGKKECCTICLPDKLLKNLDKNNISKDVENKLRNFLENFFEIKIE